MSCWNLRVSIARTMIRQANKSDREKSYEQLMTFFKGLDDARKNALLEYAEFLYERSECEPEPLVEPVLLPRPEDETVVGAIKRLSASYTMVDKQTLLHEISGLMAQHMMQGRPAAEVISEIEALFEARYQGMLKQES